MKKILCLAVLAMALSPLAIASPRSDECKVAGSLAKVYLSAAKVGINSHDSLANNPEAMYEYGVHDSVIFLVVAQDVWENRATYNDARAYAAGYRICMDLY